MSDSESDSDSSSSEEVKSTPVPVKAKAEESDSDSDSDSSSDEEETKAKKPAVKIFAKEEKKEESDSDSDSDSSDEKEAAKKPVAKPAVTAKDDDSSDSDSSSDEEEEKKKKPVAKPAAKAADNDDSDSDSSDSESEEKPAEKKKAVKAAPKKEENESDSSDDEDDSSDADDEAEEGEPKKEKESKKEPEKMEVEEEEPKVDFTTSLPKTITVTPLFKLNLADGRKGKKRKLESASSPQASKKAKAEDSSATTTTTTVASGDLKPTKDFYPTDYKNSHLKGKTSTVFIKGIDINAFEADIEAFFTDIEKPRQVRHKWFEDRPGIAFIEFSSPEVATKVVIDKNNEYIKDRYINTDWSEERKKSVNTRGPRNAHLKDTTNRVWMGNLHREVQESNIIEYVSSVGVLTDVYIIGRDETRPKIAYISFESNELATKAVETLQAGSLLDYTVRLDWAEPRQNSGGQKRKRELSEKPDGCVTCFVGRLADEVDDEKLKELFKDAGEISQIRYLERDGEFKGSAFIEFTETEATDKAVALNGSTFLNRQIRVDFAEQSNKKPRNDSGGW